MNFSVALAHVNMGKVFQGGRRERDPLATRTRWMKNGKKSRFSSRHFVRQAPPMLQTGAYEPPRLRDLQWQNRVKTRKHFIKKKKGVPCAPRNTSSYIMYSKRLGAAMPGVSPALNSVLITPALASAPASREAVGDEEVKEWGVNGYGSMTGLIRLRTCDDSMGDGSVSNSICDDKPTNSANCMQSLQQVEQRLDQDLGRFEMTFPSNSVQDESKQLMQIRLEEQESLIAHLEDENLTLRERLYLIEQELRDLQQRSSCQKTGVEAADDASSHDSSWGSSYT